MRKLIHFFALLLLVSACEKTKTCTYGGVTYKAEEKFYIDCNTCICKPDWAYPHMNCTVIDCTEYHDQDTSPDNGMEQDFIDDDITENDPAVEPETIPADDYVPTNDNADSDLEEDFDGDELEPDDNEQESDITDILDDPLPDADIAMTCSDGGTTYQAGEGYYIDACNYCVCQEGGSFSCTMCDCGEVNDDAVPNEEPDDTVDEVPDDDVVWQSTRYFMLNCGPPY